MKDNNSRNKFTMLQEVATNCPFSSHFESIINAIPDPLVFTDTDRRIIMANPAVETVFGYTSLEVLGQKTEMFYTCKEDYEEEGRFRYNLGVFSVKKPVPAILWIYKAK